jgi:molybdate transport system substrate-binding protein
MKGKRGLAACLVALAAAGCGGGDPAGARAVSIAAASDLRYSLDEILAAFSRAHPGTRTQVSYGSSGNLYAQIANGAPFDLFLSADIAYARQLEARGLVRSGSLFKYAEGRLAVWAPETSRLDVRGRGLAAVADPAVTRVAVANPEHAPYGRAAVAALRSAGLYDQVEPRLVLGENVSQALQFVQSGSADIGIVALSLALSPPVAGSGQYWPVPRDMHPPIEQGGVIVPAAPGGGVESLRAFLLGAESRAILSRYGFEVP